MLVVLATILIALGAVLVAAAAGVRRDATRRPRLARWVGGETAGVLFTLLPACGVVALFNVLIDQGGRNLTMLHIAAALAVAAAGWMATRYIRRRFTGPQKAEAVAPSAVLQTVEPSRPAVTPITGERAA
ncbi:MAG: hypothetical protein RBS99_07225 [Rhodospirillales bacterium]|jgi:hypothetical protein|nr:hypothetical protein [Rhodospirillales bacterium]